MSATSEQTTSSHADGTAKPEATHPRHPSGPLAAMRIRKKLVVLHTIFSVALGAVLVVALRPAVHSVVERAHAREVEDLLGAILATGPAPASLDLPRVRVRTGPPRELGINDASEALARAREGGPVMGRSTLDGSEAVAWLGRDEGGADLGFIRVTLSTPDARPSVLRFYVLMVVALLAVYALVAISLEVFVLPRHVYGPIRTMLLADRSVRAGDAAHELIDERMMPADELGEIMRSRNEAVSTLRSRELELARALQRLETVASDLKQKNHLLETARRNLEGADRLASLGMMSAGIAHELNTPLSVVKGLAETLNDRPGHGLSEPEAALLLRVVRRLERLSESLLDFARARPPRSSPSDLREVVEDACTLVRLDRTRMPPSSGIEISNAVGSNFIVECDADRMVQVFVNLVRNAVDAIRDSRRGGHVRIEGECVERDGAPWASLRIVDDGPGIDPDTLETLFEPFVSTRLDAHGTGLGLAVAEGIVREHGGVLTARNRPERAGAVFEVLLPAGSDTLASDRNEHDQPGADLLP